METWDDDSEERSFIHRHRTAIGLVVGLAALACVAALAIQIMRGHTASKKAEQFSMVRLMPPPPPPPATPRPTPPPDAPQPKEQPMIDQKQMMVPETKPAEPRKRDEAPKPQNRGPSGPLGMNAKGEGTGDSFGLVGRSGGNGLLGDGNGDGTGGGGTRWGWYAGEVQATVEKALRDNPHTRAASLKVEVEIWPDKIGRIARVELSGSTGEPALDASLKNQVLNGLQLQEPPPSDMPLPIVMRLTARRPQ